MFNWVSARENLDNREGQPDFTTVTNTITKGVRYYPKFQLGVLKVSTIDLNINYNSLCYQLAFYTTSFHLANKKNKLHAQLKP